MIVFASIASRSLVFKAGLRKNIKLKGGFFILTKYSVNDDLARIYSLFKYFKNHQLSLNLLKYQNTDLSYVQLVRMGELLRPNVLIVSKNSSWIEISYTIGDPAKVRQADSILMAEYMNKSKNPINKLFWSFAYNKPDLFYKILVSVYVRNA